MKRLLILLGSLLVASLSLPLAEPASATTHPGASTGGSPFTVLPVTSCSTSFGAGTPTGIFVASRLPVMTSAHGLAFYSNGLITALGPAGWACSALVAADGGQALDVYPPGSPNYAVRSVPKGAAVVQVVHEYTGHGPGAESVCPFFPASAAVAFVKNIGFLCPAPVGEQSMMLTPDIVKFTDRPRIDGNAAGSGGALASVGAAVYPQLPSSGNGASVNVSLLSCTLPKKSAPLCSIILGDFLVRNPPSDEGSTPG